jgi:hypothetical protein
LSEHGKAGQDRQAVFNPANDLQRDGLLSTIMETRATFPQSDRGKVCNAPCGQQKTKRGTVASKKPQQHHGRDGYCSSVGPDCGDDQKISDRVGQRTSHCLFGSVPRRRGQSAASSLKSSGIGISGPYCCIKRSVCNFPWRGHIRQAISISAVRAATAPSRIEPLDALTSAPRTRGQARD